MNTTVYAAMLMALLNAGQGQPSDKRFTEMARGPEGRVHLLLPEAPCAETTPSATVGFCADYKDGKSFWVAKDEGRGVAVGIGYKRAF